MRVVGVPSCQGCLNKNNGTELAPELILEKIEHTSLELPDKNFIELFEALEKAEGDFFVGGDHSITYGLVKGLKRDYENIGLIVFDAHPDCVNNFSPPTHEDFVRVLVEEKIVLPENVLLIGLRNIDPIEWEFIEKNKIRCLPMKDIVSEEQVISEIANFSDKLSVYLSLDIDVLDPKYAPGTGYPEIGGMELEFLLKVLRSIKSLEAIKRIDLVEVNPLKDKENKTINASREIIGLVSQCFVQ